jgi:hypothetical protein
MKIFRAQNVKADQHFHLEVFNNVNLLFYDNGSDFITWEVDG